MFCEECGAKIEDNNAEFCPECGKKIAANDTNVINDIKAENKFCPECGAAIVEGADFCSECGYKIVGTPTNNNLKNNSGLIIILASAALILVVVIAAFAFIGRSPHSVVKQYVKGSYKPDAKILYNLIPQDVTKAALKKIIDDDYADTKKEAKDYFCDSLEENLQLKIDWIDEELGDDWKYSYEIIEEKNLNNKELAELNKEYREEIKKFKAKAAKKITLEITMTSDFDEETREADIQVLKIGKNWYLDVVGSRSL